MNNKISNNQNFGMALYMSPYKKIAKEFGEMTANEIEKTRPKLKELAKDIDLFVKPYKAYFEPDNPRCWGVVMTANKTSNPVMAKIHSFIREYNLFSKEGYSFIPISNPNLSEKIIDDAQRIKSEALVGLKSSKNTL